MTLAPLFEAAGVIQLHTFAAIGAFVLGVGQFTLAKGTPWHRATGYVWAGLMLAIAASSLWIHTIRLWGPFSPIHILSLVTLIGVPQAVLAARRSDISGHKRGMIMLFVMALLGAGAFAALMPGRLLHTVLFGS
ncbi:MAG: DUF2306 domain-containing protein [Alphaproteobacteria bacterium]|nr:DUF2306 domain-containing protein [Alphaproteobacteria bacterium]